MKKVLIAIGIVVTIAIISHRNYVQSNEKPMSIPILMYHHFELDKDKINDMTVYKSDFEKQMKYLKENGYTAINAKDLENFIDGKSIMPIKPIMITADDGYRSNYKIMYPILKKLNMKATIFIIGKDIDDNKHNNRLSKLTWTDIKKMYKSELIDIECHTYNSHVRGNTLSGNMGIFSSPIVGESEYDYEKRINKDIKMNIKSIEENLHYTPRAFAYPYGDWSGTSENILKQNGIKVTLVASGGKEDNVKASYLLKRIEIPGKYTIDDFKRELKK
ncbi:MAG: polysaccharide deacetylase family protein [Paeniclostridium sordellii]|nr:polysaccharide deacetylase family protein [Paeniclostridium sordellii]